MMGHIRNIMMIRMLTRPFFAKALSLNRCCLNCMPVKETNCITLIH